MSAPPQPFTQEMAAFDRDHLWHPYSRMSGTAYPVVSAHGVHLELADGRRLIDAMSSWWAAIHGYNHPALNAAASGQLERMSHVMFGGLTHPAAVELGQRLLGVLPAGLDRLFFCDSGSVAVEVAIKMALQYQQARGETERRRIAAIRRGYHGDTLAAMSVCDPETGMHHLFKDVVPQQLFVRAPRCSEDVEDCDEQAVAEMEATLARRGREVAAVIVEPVVQGAGGMRIYGAGYLVRLRELCDRYGVLLIFDEIATGFGRTGRMFACEHAGGVRPDVMCVGKALSAGYLTLAATCTDARVADVIDSGDPGVFMHGPTYMANPLACAVASANLDVLAGGEWRAQVAAIEAQLQRELAPCRESARVAEVRVRGAIGVVEMREKVEADELCRRFVERGVWVRPFSNLIYVMPPYVIGARELSQVTSAIVELVG